MEYEVIAHHGVKGQKWGVIRDRVSKAKSSAEESKASKARTSEWQSAYKRRGKMTDAELEYSVSRLRLENEFKRQVNDASGANSNRMLKSAQFVQNAASIVLNTSKAANPMANMVLTGLRAAAYAHNAYKKRNGNVYSESYPR